MMTSMKSKCDCEGTEAVTYCKDCGIGVKSKAEEIAERIKLLLANGWTQMGSGQGVLFYKDDLVTNGDTIYAIEAEAE